MPSPEHNAIVENLIASLSSFKTASLEEQRKAYDKRMGAIPIPDGVALSNDRIEHMPIEWIEPGAPQGTILYLHGGGYNSGSIIAFRALCSAIALNTQCRVCLIEYRLAPEHPFPAAVDDALLAYRWLLSEKKVAPGTLAICGDSAGGGLTLATLLKVKENNLPLPSCASVLSPWTDLTNNGGTMVSGEVDDPILTKIQADALTEQYCPSEDLKNPLLSPLYGDLDGLPPIQIQVGTRESLLDDSRRFEAKAREASIEVDYFEGEDLIHVWPLIAPHAPESADALHRMGTFITKHIA